MLIAGAQFGAIDWAIVVGYMVFTTWLGARMAGKQTSVRDFFLGGRKLPWYAVSGSIIATEISAVTFVGAPYIVFQEGGNLTYLQLGIIGTLLARVIVGFVLVPAYYKREIYSPYDYIGNQLGGNTRGVATVMFSLGGMLGQSARVYLTAIVLTVVMNDQLRWLTEHLGASPLAWAIILISIVAVIWTLIGGITTVIWTDVMLFLMFLAGAFIALLTVIHNLDGGLGELLRAGWETRSGEHWWDWGKFTFFDFESRWPNIFTQNYTIWAAVIAATWGSLGPYGTDQLLVQRMFCCRNERQARWAMISSTASQVVTLLVMLIGAGLFAYYRDHQLSGEALELFNQNPNRIFPIFIVDVIPTGLKGLLIAAIFAAAISSLTSILAALSQTVMSAFYLPRRRAALADRTSSSESEDRRSVRVSRLLVVLWAIVLAIFAYYVQALTPYFPEILNLALAMAGFTGGALLAGFFLGFLPLNIDGWGYQFAAPLSVLYVFAAVFHTPWSHWICWIGAAALLLAWVARHSSRGPLGDAAISRVAQFGVLLLGLAGMLAINYFGYFDRTLTEAGDITYTILSWPWYVPLGSTVAFIWGYLLAHRRPAEEPARQKTIAIHEQGGEQPCKH